MKSLIIFQLAGLAPPACFYTPAVQSMQWAASAQILQTGKRLVEIGRVYITEFMENRIREIRKAKSITLEELAAQVGTSKGYLSELERGKKRLNADHMQKLSDALEVTPSDLFASSDSQFSTPVVKGAFIQLAELTRIMGGLSDDERELVIDFAKALLFPGSPEKFLDETQQ